MKQYKIIVLLTLATLLLTAATAMAFGEIRYPDRPLNLRDGRSARATWVGALYPGQKVRVAFLKDGWVAVFEPDETRATEKAAVGYSNVKYLKKKRTRVEPKPWGELVTVDRKLNIRTKSSIRGRKVGQLQPGERVLIDFPEDNWTMVFAPDATIRSKMNARGFSSAKYFKPVPQSAATDMVEVLGSEEQEKPTPGAQSADPERDPEDWGKVIIVKRKVNLREGRTTGSHYIRTLQPGEVVRVDYLKSGWYAVFRKDELIRKENRALGYALRSLLEETPDASPASKPAPAPVAKSEPVGGTKKTMIIDKSRFTKTKRPDPIPDRNAHGYQYRLLEKSETTKYGESWITLKVFLSTTKLPGNDALRNFATTLWKEHMRLTKNLVVMVYLPGMDTEDLAYGVIKFDDTNMLELWVRKTTLFGTDFM